MITLQTEPQPADLADVRATNLAVVLLHLRMRAPCSRADIASATVAPTVTLLRPQLTARSSSA